MTSCENFTWILQLAHLLWRQKLARVRVCQLLKSGNLWIIILPLEIDRVCLKFSQVTNNVTLKNTWNAKLFQILIHNQHCGLWYIWCYNCTESRTKWNYLNWERLTWNFTTCRSFTKLIKACLGVRLPWPIDLPVMVGVENMSSRLPKQEDGGDSNKTVNNSQHKPRNGEEITEWLWLPWNLSF